MSWKIENDVCFTRTGFMYLANYVLYLPVPRSHPRVNGTQYTTIYTLSRRSEGQKNKTIYSIYYYNIQQIDSRHKSKYRISSRKEVCARGTQKFDDYDVYYCSFERTREMINRLRVLWWWASRLLIYLWKRVITYAAIIIIIVLMRLAFFFFLLAHTNRCFPVSANGMYSNFHRTLSYTCDPSDV